ncbi:MAG: L-aspartate oxidase, partial [Candidatus Atribacteria bacterium]|nr:L-aspartate oxidase [Candidatus Atribacteria bacterium]
SYHISQKAFKKIDTIKIKKELQDLMWNKVGITRTYKGLVEAQKKIAQWKSYLNREFTEIDQIELINLVTLADLVTRSALTRKESRGAHYRQDFPNRDDVNWKRYIEY